MRTLTRRGPAARTRVQAVVFLTFWQGLFLAVISAFSEAVDGGGGGGERDHKSLQNFLICLEMFLASIMMMFAFPWREYRLIAPPDVCEGGAVRSILRALRHATRVGDVFQDTYHQFATRYQTYILPPTDDTFNPKARAEEERERIRTAPAQDAAAHDEEEQGAPSAEFVYRASDNGDAPPSASPSHSRAGSDRGAADAGAPDSHQKKAKRISGVFLTREQRKHTEKQHGHAVRTFVLKVRPPAPDRPPGPRRGSTALTEPGRPAPQGQEMRGVRTSLSSVEAAERGGGGQADAQRGPSPSGDPEAAPQEQRMAPDAAPAGAAAAAGRADGDGDMVDLVL